MFGVKERIVALETEIAELREQLDKATTAGRETRDEIQAAMTVLKRDNVQLNQQQNEVKQGQVYLAAEVAKITNTLGRLISGFNGVTKQFMSPIAAPAAANESRSGTVAPMGRAARRRTRGGKA